jgi:hypothetical protein
MKLTTEQERMLEWRESLPEHIKNDIEVDIYVPMPPIKSYKVKLKILSIEKAPRYFINEDTE